MEVLILFHTPFSAAWLMLNVNRAAAYKQKPLKSTDPDLTMASIAVHGNSIVPGAGVTIDFTTVGAVVKPNPPAAGQGVFFCPLPNPVNAPVKATNIKIDANRILTNVKEVTLFSGTTEVANITPGPFATNTVVAVASVDGSADAGWNLAVHLEFINAASSITISSLAVFF